MGNKSIKVKPGKTQSALGFIVGILFIILGITVAIPMFGIFGIFWTAIAGFITFSHYKNAFTEKGMATHEIVIEEDSEISAEPSRESIEDRLLKLESLYHQGLITQEEYDSKRKEILDKL
ncbi:MAG: SHOCT domain-containing protein [Monoglobales bacterium]|uniref:SHOCT domain-containing protein n=1 Tax=Candidatus Ventrimonas sp. TaxID=3048889 RepID=UPI003A24B862